MLPGENYRRRECQERALRLRGLEDGGVGGNGRTLQFDMERGRSDGEIGK
jgi:hypothetical protein